MLILHSITSFVTVKEKFINREYDGIDQFVSDFRTMLQNCYRYNGPDHAISKKAQRLETMLDQKLSLLSRFDFAMKQDINMKKKRLDIERIKILKH